METDTLESSVKNVFSIKEVLSDSIRVYKASFKPIIILSLISSILSIFMSAVGYLEEVAITDTELKFSYGIFSFVITVIIDFYISLRIIISSYILADCFYDGRTCTAKVSFVQSREVYWRYIGINILFGLILLIPTMFLFICYIYFQSITLKYMATVVFIIPIAFLFVRYFFASISGALIREKHRYFDLSWTIVKGASWKVFFLMIITNFVFFIPYQICAHVILDFNALTQDSLFIIQIINQVLLFFAMPFSHIADVVMYRKLLKHKNLD